MKHNPENLSWIPAKWDAPPGINAGITTRTGGFSNAPFNEFNLASHVGDNELYVRKNRNKLIFDLKLKNEPVWLNQIHENRIVNADGNINHFADGAITSTPGIPCVVMTADCVPLLMCNRAGNKVAAIHIGWRGLSSGILTNAIKAFDTNPEEILVWIGPHIRQKHYKVGIEVYRQCVEHDKNLEIAFNKINDNHWYASLELMIQHILKKKDIHCINWSSYCTYADDNLFFSYRRDKTTGRMACLIWIDK